MTTEDNDRSPDRDPRAPAGGLPPLVYGYSRRQAVDDGVLVDLREWAGALGFAFPVACTAAVWHGYVVPGPGPRGLGQGEAGRAHDLLFALRSAVARAARSSPPAAFDRVEFEVLFLMPPRQHAAVRLVAVCGPGDAAEPVITVMLPGED